MMWTNWYETIIVGSGAGGAVLARELSERGERVLVIERGIQQDHLGNLPSALSIYDINRWTQMPVTSREGVLLWRAFTAGGSTVVSCGNATRCLENELAALGVEISADLDELASSLRPGIAPNELVSNGGRKLAEAAKSLGINLQAMPKFVDAEKCRGCGQCVLGCRYGAKWTARAELAEAVRLGAEVIYDSEVQRVIVEDGRAVGVRARTPFGEGNIQARRVVLAAGGLASPALLLRSGVQAGQGLFADLFVNVYGVTDGINLLGEPTMSLVSLDFHESQGFLVSPYVNHARLARTIELGPAGGLLDSRNLLGMMVKITDENSGQIFADGSFSKPVTARDQSRLDAGAKVAKEILMRAGAQPNSLRVSRVQGAHPGGGAAIGRVVDANLQTEVQGLYVCDSSVLPTAPGLPPILTIVALARRLARTLSPQLSYAERLATILPAG